MTIMTPWGSRSRLCARGRPRASSGRSQGDHDDEPLKRVANRRIRCRRDRLRHPPELTAAKASRRRSAPARVVANAILGSKPYRGEAVSMMVCDCMPSSISLPDAAMPLRLAPVLRRLSGCGQVSTSVAKTFQRVCRLRVAESASVVTHAGRPFHAGNPTATSSPEREVHANSTAPRWLRTLIGLKPRSSCAHPR